MDSTLIRAHGDRDYWDNVAILARWQKTSTAAMVKEAMDALYGDMLAKLEPLFLLPTVDNQQHINKHTPETENA